MTNLALTLLPTEGWRHGAQKEICYCKHCGTMFLVVIDEMETGDRSSFARRALEALSLF